MRIQKDWEGRGIKIGPDFYRPKRSFGQGYIFTGVCHSVNRGVWSRGGSGPGGSPIFRGVWSPIFRGVSNFLGGWVRGLQFFGGGGLQFFRGSPIFQGGGLQFFRGGGLHFFRGCGLQFFGGLQFSGGWSPIFRGAPIFGGSLRNMVNVQPVRILLECILVLKVDIKGG